MATLNHGVRTGETATSLIPTVAVDSALPLVIGTAPVNLLDDPASAVNVPRLCYSYSEAVGYFGFEAAKGTGIYDDEGEELERFRYTLSEHTYSTFTLYGNDPVVYINVLDPDKHNTGIETATATVADGQAVIEEAGILLSTVTLSATVGDISTESDGDSSSGDSSGGTSTESGGGESADSSGGSESADASGGSESAESDGSGELQVITAAVANSSGAVSEVVTYTQNEDFTLAFDDDGYLVISVIEDDNGEPLIPEGTVLSISGKKIDPSQVTGDDIIGGVTVDNVKTGLELADDIFPKYGVIYTLILAPYFSREADVAAALATKCEHDDESFYAMALIDADTTEAVKYSDLVEYKSGVNVVNETQVLCWPMINFSGTIYNMSTHLAGLMAITDDDNGGIPSNSPSNKTINATGLILDSGEEVVLTKSESNYLNSQGVGTCFNFQNGWTFWGNRTAAYPSNTDPKDAFINVKRMFFYVRNILTVNIWQKVDEPGNRRLINTIVNSVQLHLNSLTSAQHLLGARIEFNEDDNSITELMDGHYYFKVYITPPSPAEEIEFNLEIDTDYYQTLFEGTE